MMVRYGQCGLDADAGNQLLDKPHHQTPLGLKFELAVLKNLELAAESPLMMIMLVHCRGQIYQLSRGYH